MDRQRRVSSQRRFAPLLGAEPRERRRIVAVIAASTLMVAGCSNHGGPVTSPHATANGAATSAWASGSSAPAGRAPTGVSTTRHITSSGIDREYILSLPAGYVAGRPIPVVFAFHGRGETAGQFRRYSDLDRLPAIVVYPQGVDKAWEGADYAKTNNGSQDTRLVRDILASLEKAYSVDTARVYATGKSNGGGFAARLGCELPTTFAAVAPVAGAYYEATWSNCVGTPLSILEIHGTADPVMAYGGGGGKGDDHLGAMDLVRTFAQRDGCSGRPTSTRISPHVTQFSWSGCAPGIDVRHLRIEGGGHTWPGASAGSGPGATNREVSATDLIWSFLSAHTRKG